ncbi:ferritin-like domain-containing protein [Gryllotalpicola ginsengisoli]|uniref:ferritin-like domain-containing protein n=1 Tax=Gryllotalpicola ginsengisoli TaxID=444608 RepID=UPI0003B4E8F8|nr:ferritin-like domain-containing protein [Gryllotalpicola ginsengisoli]
MFEHFDKPQELFEYKLGTALTMEHDSLNALRELEMASQSEEVRNLFAHHQGETKQQIANLEQAFQLLGVEPDQSPSPTTKGLMKEGAALVAKTDKSLVDSVTLSAALENEHYEIAAYQSLIISAEAMGATQVCDLLKQNLDQEMHTSEELNQAARMAAHAMPAA